MLALRAHQCGKPVKQIANVMRPRRRFGVALEAERGLVGAGQALQGAVKQADVRGPQVGG